jgi:hypothetical protein
MSAEPFVQGRVVSRGRDRDRERQRKKEERRAKWLRRF